MDDDEIYDALFGCETDDCRLAGKIAYGDPLTEEALSWIEAEGDELIHTDDPARALRGGLLIRIARLERQLAERT